MSGTPGLDCIVIGYNEPPFEQYEALLARYGTRAESYRDLRFSFVELAGHKLDYCGLLNHAYALAHPGQALSPADEFKSGDVPNLAAAYLTHGLRARFSAAYVNLFQHERDALARLLERDPLCVAITTTFYVLNLPVIEMVRFIRAHNPAVKIVVGGPLVGNHCRRWSGEELALVLDEIGADIYVVDPQGERTLERVVECLKSGGSLGSVPNLLYRAGRRLHATPIEPENNSLDEHDIDWRRLADHPLGPTLQSRTARSCAFNCSFCAYPTRAGKLALASLDTVDRELESMRVVGGVSHVVFIDDTFNVPLKRFKDLCARMIERRFEFSWYSYFRCSNADEEAIELAARSGCRGVFLGVESGSDQILRNMNKAAAAAQYRRGVELLKRHGILTFGSFIAGFPGETPATFRETVDFIRDAALDFYRIQLWYCEPGTPIFADRARWDISGEGFRWRHATMASGDAMSLVEQAFVEIHESEWLPQWSFDFWIIPYLSGRGVSADRFRRFMAGANRLLRLEVAGLDARVREARQQAHLDEMVAALRGLDLQPAAGTPVR